MFRILRIETAPRLPLGSLVPVSGYPSAILDHPGHMHQVPSHEGGVAAGEVVFGPSRAWIKIDQVIHNKPWVMPGSPSGWERRMRLSFYMQPRFSKPTEKPRGRPNCESKRRLLTPGFEHCIRS